MTSITGVSGLSGLSSLSALTGASSASATSAASGTSATGASSFASALGGVVDSAQSLQGTSDSLALKVASGDLDSLGSAQVASTRAEVTLELVASLRNKAVDGLSTIMNMQA